jgi:uncharacterized protein YfaP (DUF2135 family)
MLVSLFALACMGTLIIVGCKVNLRLHHAGALGASFARGPRGSNTVAVQSPNQETTAEDQFFLYLDQTSDKHLRYARIGLPLVGLLLVVVCIFVISMISVAL